MARAELEDFWVTDLSVDEVRHRLQRFVDQNDMKMTNHVIDEIVMKQGSQLTTRFLGGWFVNPKDIPKQATIRFYAISSGKTKVEVKIEETLGFGVLDSKFKKRYEDFFKGWIKILESDVPATSP